MEAPTKGTFRLAGREFPAVTWYKDPALRRTYICLMFVILTSATNGYDGSMINGLQSLQYWQECENLFTTLWNPNQLTTLRLRVPQGLPPRSSGLYHVHWFSRRFACGSLHRRRSGKKVGHHDRLSDHDPWCDPPDYLDQPEDVHCRSLLPWIRYCHCPRSFTPSRH